MNIKFELSVKGANGLLIDSFSVTERISDLFTIVAKFIADWSKIDMDLVIGEDATIKITMGKEEKYFNGIVESITEESIAHYKVKNSQDTSFVVTIRPRLWLLSKTKNYQIFQKQSTLDIVKKICQEHKIQIKSNASKSGQKKREFVVQYNESDLNFISRLMEEDGIFFYFEHAKDKHALILSDNSKAASSIKDAGEFYDMEHTLSQHLNKITSLSSQRSLISKTAKLASFDFQKPEAIGKATGNVTAKSKYGTIFEDYTDRTIDAPQSKVDQILASEESQYSTIFGKSTCITIASGKKFTIKKHSVTKFNSDYFILSCSHNFSLEEDSQFVYSNEFSAIPFATAFRPQIITPRPEIHGTETAIVVGDKDGDVNTDEYGRIKVKFHWDDRKSKDTSFWIRVAQKSAGQHYGTLNIPRVGQEVIIGFIKGNPDAPIVIGALYNGKNKPKYLPSKTIDYWAATTIGAMKDDVRNEIKFDGEKDKEKMEFYAQKDMLFEILNDFTQNIGKNAAITLKEGNFKITLKKGNQEMMIEDGERKITIKKNDTLEIIDGDMTIRTKKGKILIDSKGDVTIDSKGNINLKSAAGIKIEAKKKIEILGENVNIDAKGQLTQNAKLGANISAKGKLALKGSLINLN